jgi:cation diffusion facilitator family transporter
MTEEFAEKREKRRVTLISLVTACVLIVLKLFVGLSTGYLTLISEALHSSLDALVTIITFFSIRYAERPADADHAYGHGKAENLAAFTESLLLFFAIFFILKEVVERLFFKSVVISPNIWAVLVLVFSVLCDIQRSRALRRIADKYKSPAIEADAVHFKADFITSAIALSGILITYIAQKAKVSTGVYTLVDVATTCAVLVIVIRMVFRILIKSAGVLLDRTVPDQAAMVKDIVAGMPEVIDIEKVRTREAGKQTFVDLTVEVDRNLSVESSYSIGKQVEEKIKKQIKDVDITLQMKPVPSETESIAERIRSLGAKEGHNLHHISVHDVQGTLHVDLDLEVEGNVRLAEAHAISDYLEAKIKKDNPAISEINTHVDWRKPSPVYEVKVDHDQSLVKTIEAIVKEKEEILSCARISVEEEVPGELFLTIHCTMNPDAAAETVQAVSEDLEKRLKERIQGVGRVIIHVEPGK